MRRFLALLPLVMVGCLTAAVVTSAHTVRKPKVRCHIVRRHHRRHRVCIRVRAKKHRKRPTATSAGSKPKPPTAPVAGPAPKPPTTSTIAPPAATITPPATTQTTTLAPAAIQHVVVISMENQDYSNIYGPRTYETSVANTYGLATNYYGIGHFSTDNYIAMTSGASWNSCLGGDSGPGSCPQNQDNIFHQLGSGQAQDLIEPGNTDVNHNPVEYYTDLGCSGPGTCAYEQTLPSTFTSATLNPKYTFISPNKTDDGHDSSAGTGDSWLSSEVPKIMATPQYTGGSLAILIVYDESNVSDTQGATTPPNNHVYLSVISPNVRAVKDSTVFTHYSLLRTTEDLLGLSPLGSATSATTMVGHFGL
jgi:hypothetical protein